MSSDLAVNRFPEAQRILSSASRIIAKIPISVVVGVSDVIFSVAAMGLFESSGSTIERKEDGVGFIPSVVLFPICEEFFFRCGVQPLIAGTLKVIVPSLGEKKLKDVSIANIVAAVATGILFGAAHYYEFEEGNIEFVVISAFSGALYGLTKEYYGINHSIRAHMINNFIAETASKLDL